MSEHNENCECDECFRKAVLSSVDRWIEKTVKENPGIVCPFCGTNPSKKARYGSGFKDSCGHEIREDGLVIGWRKTNKSKTIKCICPEKTRQLVYVNGKWREEI